ncbi:MAG TPA: helicase-related protein, partial [Candidatus Eisenbacteria bacterium]|nr:helicase-related protein [Candidatus Eisenbacteria bacterium]
PAQRRAVDAVGADLDLETPMRRLLLGDVGSGKTVVALAAAVRAVGAGQQAAILAPTGLLAEQHAATASRFLASTGIPYGLRTAATTLAERRRLEAGFQSGAIPIAIGTHALLERDISFRSLALVVVDEQHRFGVRQRITLTRRGDSEASAHLLVLTATPIPRSLAMTLYGDLDLSILDEKPPGRAPVETRAIDGDRPGALVELLQDEVAAGGSAFVVYPVVEESETLDLKAATAMAAKLSSTASLGAAGVALVHGRLKAEERRDALARFRSGEARILVATTVVEVGLDVPEATLVAIEHPERFGLAQLHQLRGRVGRADRPGRCVLILNKGVGVVARKRLHIFQTVSDGFRLAEEDLRLRGPGEILGTSQHGFPEFRAADPARDTDLIEAARDWGRLLLEQGQAEGGGPGLKAWIEAHFAGADRYLGSG